MKNKIFVFLDQPRTPFGGEEGPPPQKSRILTGFIVWGASLTVVSVGAALTHTQTLGPRQGGAAVIRAWGAPARVKLGRVFSESLLEVAPSCHRTGDVSHQVRDGSKLRADGREAVWSTTFLGHMLPSLTNSHGLRGKVWKILHFKGIVVQDSISAF